MDCAGFMREPVDAPPGRRLRAVLIQETTPVAGLIMAPALPDGLPQDVLIVEDDPIIALDFEDTISASA